MAQCKYRARSSEPCPHETVKDEKLCIFHRPVEEKEPAEFWKSLASYLCVLLGKAGNAETTKWFEANPSHWVLKERDETLFGQYRSRVKPGEAWDFRGFVFPTMDGVYNLTRFVFPKVDFGGARFSGGANFWSARFSGNAGFYDARFHENANFGLAQFSEVADFPGALFWEDADFVGARFGGNANFRYAQFSRNASFVGVRFNGPAHFDQASVNSRLDLSRAAVRNRVSFAGTQIGKKAAVLLWDLDFVHGTSDVSFEKGYLRGRVVEPAGQVVFRDIGKNMNRVSFLHTDIFTDRLLVRFSNVKWETDARRFIFDAVFAFHPEKNWKGVTGPVQDELALLPVLYGLSDDASAHELESLVRQDVERIAREIRTSHEKYGNYPDAGDYYVAEMDFRRARTGWRSPPLMRPALELYKWVSNYGESPALAGRRLAGLLFGFGLVYLFAGFSLSFREEPIRRLFTFDSSQFWPTLGDYLLAVLFAFTNLVPGWFRADGTCPVGPLAGIVAVIQTILGVSILALFLLAVRRRFRR
jgi:hypothetical protein